MAELTEDLPSDELKLYHLQSYWNTMALGFTIALGFSILYSIINNAPGIAIPIALILLTFLVFVFRASADTTPQLVINPEGITSATWAWKTIPWADIKAVSIVNLPYQRRALRLELVDNDKYYQQMSGLQRGLHQLYIWLGWGHLDLSTVSYDKHEADLLKHIVYLKSAGKISVELPGIEGNDYFVDSRKL